MNIDVRGVAATVFCLCVLGLDGSVAFPVPAHAVGATVPQEAIEPGVLSDTPQVASVSPLADAIRNRVEAGAGLPDRMVIRDERVQTAASLSVFYERRAYEPAWVTPEGLSTSARRLLDVLAGADADGLQPADYHVSQLRAWIEQLDARGASPATAGRLVDIELLLTDGFLLFGTHLLIGRVDAASLHSNWRAERRQRDLVELLGRAVRDGNPRQVLHELRPPQPEYARLVEALAAYREIAAVGEWPTIPDGERLSPGDESDRVPALRARLAAEPEAVAGRDDLPEFDAAAGRMYEEALVEAVRAFQRRHGLEADGIIGPATLAALNASPARRVRQLTLNIERWRWLPQDLGDRHVLVNAADFRLDAVADGEVELTMRAIVGRQYRQTPVFSDRITYIVFSPFWHVPHSLAVQDQLPLQKRDPDYFRRLGFRLFRGWGTDAVEVSPASIDWSTVTAKSFGYRLRQDSGPQNFLGTAKFMFPNPYNVYLHDTPARELFRKHVRNFSSGCIRLEDSRSLALWLLSGDSAWSAGRVDSAMRADSEQTAFLARPVPVHLLYWTAFVSDDGAVHFRPDIYDRDDRLADALAEPPPEAVSTNERELEPRSS